MDVLSTHCDLQWMTEFSQRQTTVCVELSLLAYYNYSDYCV